MATEKQVLELLNRHGDYITRKQLADELKEPMAKHQIVLTRLSQNKGLITIDNDRRVCITEAGKRLLSGDTIFGDGHKEPPGEPPPEPEEPPTDPDNPPGRPPTPASQKKLTEVEEFAKMIPGSELGMTPEALFRKHEWAAGISAEPQRLRVLQEAVFGTGDYKDLKHVEASLARMGVQGSALSTFMLRWKAYLKSANVLGVDEYTPTAGPDGKITPSNGKGKRDYILDERDIPVYVGEGLGSFDEDYAKDLAKIRAGRGHAAAAANQPAPAEKITDVLTALSNAGLIGNKDGKKKMVVFKSDGQGGVDMQEVEEGAQTISVGATTPSPQPKTILHNEATGENQEIDGEVKVIHHFHNPQANQSPPVKYMIPNPQTGMYQEWVPGQPLPFATGPQQPQQPAVPAAIINAVDNAGNPLRIDLSTYFALEDHKAKTQREKEGHETKIEIAKTAKDWLSNMAKAAQNMVEDE